MNGKSPNNVTILNNSINMEEDENQMSVISCGIDLENNHLNKPSLNVNPNSPNFMSMVHHKWRKIWKRDSAEITPTDPSYKTVYLGNVVTTWAKGEGCLERPASALWKNHCQGRGSIKMLISVAPSGLKAQTREHGLTEYWANRLTWCGVPPDYPKLFCWIYRHEGRKLKQELRCHAVLCSKESQSQRLANSLKNRLTEALFDFKKEKILRQNARLSLVQSLYNTSATKRRLVLMSSNSQNYKPPLERSKSAPKLSCIEEFEEDEDEENFNDSEMTILECELEDVPELRIIQEEEEEKGSCLPYANGEARVNPEEEFTKVEDPLTPPKSPISHRKSYSHPPTQVTHNPEGSRRPHTVPMDAKLNLPYMSGYDKVMQLLDMPAGDTHQLLLEGDEDEFSYTGQNSDPVASDGSESVEDSNCEDEYSKVIRRRNSSERKRSDEDREDEINDNVSDESGYSEEAVVVVTRRNVDGAEDLNMDPNGSPTIPKKSSTKNLSSSTIIITGKESVITNPKTKTATTTTFKSDHHGGAPIGTTATTLIVYDNLCFEI